MAKSTATRRTRDRGRGHGCTKRAVAWGGRNIYLRPHTDHSHTPISALLTRASHFLYYSEVQAKHAHAHRLWSRSRRPSPRPGHGRPPATRERLPTAPKLAAQLAAQPPAACCAPPDEVYQGGLQNGEVRAVDELAGGGIVGVARDLRAKQAVSEKHDVGQTRSRWEGKARRRGVLRRARAGREATLSS